MSVDLFLLIGFFGGKNEAYKNILAEQLMNIGPPCPDSLHVNDVQSNVDKYVEDITHAMPHATLEAGCVPPKVFRPKPYWCPELSHIRDRKNALFYVWSQAGKPRAGELYNCYNGVKKMFRCVTRQCSYDIQNIGFLKTNTSFNDRKINYFWKRIKMVRNKKVRSNLERGNMADYYQSVMNDELVLSKEQIQIKILVEAKFEVLKEQHHSINIAPDYIAKLIDGLNRNSAPGIDGITAEHLLYGKSDLLCSYLSILIF